jgi:tripartite-type tricarboxylate transporter receptor subunit TctC
LASGKLRFVRRRKTRKVFKNKYLLHLIGVMPASPAVAAEYPERPVRVVVGFPAGGATDVLARRVGNKLRERIGQQIVIDNRAGAGGLIAHEFVALVKQRPGQMTYSAAGNSWNPMSSQR